MPPFPAPCSILSSDSTLSSLMHILPVYLVELHTASGPPYVASRLQPSLAACGILPSDATPSWVIWPSRSTVVLHHAPSCHLSPPHPTSCIIPPTNITFALPPSASCYLDSLLSCFMHPPCLALYSIQPSVSTGSMLLGQIPLGWICWVEGHEVECGERSILKGRIAQ